LIFGNQQIRNVGQKSGQLACLESWILQMPNPTKHALVVSSLSRCMQGSAAIEYATLAALVSLALLMSLSSLGKNLDVTFSHVASAIGGAPPADSLGGNPDGVPDECGGQC